MEDKRRADFCNCLKVIREKSERRIKPMLTSPERAAGIKAICEEGIALAIFDEESALGGLPSGSPQRSLELAIGAIRCSL